MTIEQLIEKYLLAVHPVGPKNKKHWCCRAGAAASTPEWTREEKAPTVASAVVAFLKGAVKECRGMLAFDETAVRKLPPGGAERLESWVSRVEEDLLGW